MSIRWKFLSIILAIEIIIFAAFGYTIFVLLSKKIDLKKEFETAVETFIEGDLKKSKSLFLKLQDLNPGDKAVLFYLSIISYYEKVGIPRQWYGTVEMDSK